MIPVLKDLESFAGWEAALAFLSRENQHFVTAREAPTQAPVKELRRRIILIGIGHPDYCSMPDEADENEIWDYCNAVLHQEADGVPLAGHIIHEFATELRGKFELSEIGGGIIVKTSRIFHAEGASILVYNETNNDLEFIACYTKDQATPEKLMGLKVPVGVGVAGWVAEKKRPLLVPDTARDGRFHDGIDAQTNFSTRGLIAAPIIIGEELIGVIEVINKSRGHFTQKDLNLLEYIGTIIAIFIEKAQLSSQRITFAQALAKAEFASSVLHNISNVLASFRVSSTNARNLIDQSVIPKILRTREIFTRDHRELVQFLNDDKQGKLLPTYLNRLLQALEREHETLIHELGDIDEKSEIMQQIIKAQQDHATGDLATVSLTDLLDEALRVQRPFFDQEAVSVQRDQQEVGDILGEAGVISQILINLLKNALEAMNQSPEKVLIISLQKHQREVILKITDSGHGIHKNHLPKLFTHGFTTKKEGHGFGLSYCARVMKGMMGNIFAESGGPGKGASFTLVFRSAL